ncbi:pentatricopeptide repeat-containing protein At3g24000, mitochondrial [Amborella trichopoda]|uniref:pentatricopeptide repeat-containing protein At3g24000, mitochondrial n=1 Tax=Amborella trichopoda TaxID=13333 RepID=UPI0009BFB122|nr:pentatricopeptide repeat-containing protein At3g24000, mitochondrial [Amborella trichopoda]|eukprot:XP_011628825.2 pentatricopeptide repeat-containing protein At3g24000, mitochondrial [Amborella trichopoda]
MVTSPPTQPHISSHSLSSPLPLHSLHILSHHSLSSTSLSQTPPSPNKLPLQSHTQQSHPNKRIPIQQIKAHHIHAHLLKTGQIFSPYNGNSLIHEYMQSGLTLQARRVFDEMPQRNIVSWTSAISGYTRNGKPDQALALFFLMLNSGFYPNEFGFGSLLRACVEARQFKTGHQLHGLIEKSGLGLNVFVGSALIVLYSRSMYLAKACRVLNRMEAGDTFAWTSMIVGYSNGGFSLEALELFSQMIESEVRPSEFTFTSVLKACASMEAVKLGSQAHGYAIKLGFEDNYAVRVSLADLYAKCGDMLKALILYDRAPHVDVVLCTVIIGGYAQIGDSDKSMEIFVEMLNLGLLPNAFTLASMIVACSNSHRAHGPAIHGHAIKSNCDSILHVEGALVHMYAKMGKMEDACRVFKNMMHKDDVSCSSILTGFSRNGYDADAIEFYCKLHRSGVKPDAFSLASVISSCAKLSDHVYGRQHHAQVMKHGHVSDTFVAGTLVDMYAKSGFIEEARQIFDDVPVRDRVLWSAMVDGYAEHGMGKKALRVFDDMIEGGVRPNEVTFVSVLYACSHAGLVTEGIRYFDTMFSDHGIEPVMHHYACVVDLLGRAGRLDDALDFITRMPMQPNALVWRALLGSCRIHNNLEMGLFAAENVLKLEPEDDATYVLLSNMYAISGRWDKVTTVREKMRDSGIKKMPGLSWIEIGRVTHVFGSRDESHPQKKPIYEKLDELIDSIKVAGYVPQTSHALHNVDDEEREGFLCHHSERIAVAFGLLSTCDGSPIQIFKNLRVCGDCHDALKYMSLVTCRKITVRDVSRFHHFAAGDCSCGDFW